MGIYLDKSCEDGQRYRDISLFCDNCKDEGYGSTRSYDSRRLAKKDGWVRKWSKKQRKYVDICPNCKKVYFGE